MEPFGNASPPISNVYGEHIYKARVIFGSSTASTWRSKDLVVERPTTTTLKLTLPKSYAEITDFHVGRKAAASVAGLEWIITDNSVTTTGEITLTSIESDSGSATAPASGDVAYITLGVSVDHLNDLSTGSTA